MAKYGLAGILILLVSPLFADQTSSQYKRDKMLFQILFEVELGVGDGDDDYLDSSTHAYVTGSGGSSGQVQVTGKHGEALSVNGNGGVEFPDLEDTPENAIQDFTIVTSYRRQANLSQACIVCKNDAIGTTSIMGVNGNRPFINFSIAGNPESFNPIIPPNILEPERWYHVVYRRKSGVTKSIFLDGVLISSSPTVSGTYDDNDNDATRRLDIGTNFRGANNNFIGDIDEVTWYREALSDGEIRGLYSQWLGRQRQLLH